MCVCVCVCVWGGGGGGGAGKEDLQFGSILFHINLQSLYTDVNGCQLH